MVSWVPHEGLCRSHDTGYSTYATLRTLPYVRYPTYATLRTLPYVRYPTYATLRTLPYVRYPTYATLRTLPFVGYPACATLRTLPYVRYPTYATLRTLPNAVRYPTYATLHELRYLTMQGSVRVLKRCGVLEVNEKYWSLLLIKRGVMQSFSPFSSKNSSSYIQFR